MRLPAILALMLGLASACNSVKESVSTAKEAVTAHVPIAKLCHELAALSDTPMDHTAGCTKSFRQCNDADVTAMRQELGKTLACLGELDKGKVTKSVCRQDVGAELDKLKLSGALSANCKGGIKEIETAVAAMEKKH